jgi:hypothetical protein
MRKKRRRCASAAKKNFSYLGCKPKSAGTRTPPYMARRLATAIRATVGSSHDDARPDNSTLHTGNIYLFSLHISRFVLLLLRQRRGAAAAGTTIKYLRKTTSGTVDIGLGTTPNYLRGAASNGRAQRSSTFDAQRAPPWLTAWAPRSITCTAQQAAPRESAWEPRPSTFSAKREAPRATAGRSDQVSATHNERRRGQRPGQRSSFCAPPRASAWAT